MRFARLAHGVNELSQEKPSGSLKSGSGQTHPSCRTAAPGRKRIGRMGSDLALRQGARRP
ncbi:hypothetical protein SGM_0901 [Streptomyces griseoaurantiacus M045]|uniref:Uncharacterized protein n=1 Tax=Streptomyces griseoaurantiacus M045 TaxID=996637 RepID=F3NCN7_9ACTN|nr:hypothetical protein SGM_0901 [Streptomyces griseoaurantiacus M045]